MFLKIYQSRKSTQNRKTKEEMSSAPARAHAMQGIADIFFEKQRRTYYVKSFI